METTAVARIPTSQVAINRHVSHHTATDNRGERQSAHGQPPEARTLHAAQVATEGGGAVARGEPVDLRALWEELLAGRLEFCDVFSSEARYFSTLKSRRSSSRQPRALAGRGREILERVLLGEAQKSIAFDLNVAQSTIACSANRGLGRLGLSCSPASVPPLLVVIVRASRLGEHHWAIGESMSTEDGLILRAVGIERLDTCLTDPLTPAEHEVARLRLEGNKQDDIAMRRGTSSRTVANQLAAVFMKLGVSGRLALLNHACACQQRSSERPPERPIASP